MGKISYTSEDMKAIDYLAFKMNVPSDWLVALLIFESGGFNAQARNPLKVTQAGIDRYNLRAKKAGKPLMPQSFLGESVAVGLNQLFYNNVWPMFGMTPSQLLRKYPTIAAQVSPGGPVYRYMFMPPNNPPYAGLAELAMANFLPAHRKAPLDTKFSAAVQKDNPGIRTPRDYLKRVLATMASMPTVMRYAERNLKKGSTDVA